LPDAADVSAAVEVTATEVNCDRSADDSADDDPAFLIGGQGESESGPMESRAAKPPRRDELFAARSLEAREKVAPQERVVRITPANRRKCHAGFPCRRRHRITVMPLAFVAVRAPLYPQGCLRHIVPLALVPHTRHERRRQPCPSLRGIAHKRACNNTTRDDTT